MDLAPDAFLHGHSKSREGQALNDFAGNLPPSRRADFSAKFEQAILSHGVDQITLAECGPVQAIGFMENHLCRPGRSCGSLRGTEHDVYLWLVRDPGFLGEDHGWMRLRPAWGLPKINFPGFQSSKGGMIWAVVKAASTLSQSLDSLLRYQRSKTADGNGVMFGKSRSPPGASRFSASGRPQRMARR